MEAVDYTDIVARFSDELAAEMLASFISSAGVPCDVVELWDYVRREAFCIRVQRSRISELRQALDLKPVATRLNSTAAHLMAGRLAREGVPCYVGGGHVPGALGDSDVPLGETSESGFFGSQYTVSVPERFLKAALRTLNAPLISDVDLEKLALRTAPDPEDPP